MAFSVAVLGAGSIGEILCRGLLRAGWDASQLVMAARRGERAREAEERTGVRTLLDPVAAAAGRDVVVVAVKPRDVPGLVDQMGGAITTGQVLVSVAAGVPVRTYEAAFPDVPVVRAMPNTPSMVDEGITAYCAGTHVTATALEKAIAALEAMGPVIELDEELMDAVTAVSGTGPAYLFLLAETLVEAAIREGLPHHAATRLVEQTLRGAGILLSQSERTPFELRAQVTSPGGTTAAAMHVLEQGGFRAVVEDAVRAAANRSRELGQRAGGSG